MPRPCTNSTRKFLLLVVAALAPGCGSAATEWKSRPPAPESKSWHCLETGQGSFCEKSFDACRSAHRYVSQRTVAVTATIEDCRPAAAVYCTSYLFRPAHPPESRELITVHQPSVDGWVYDCASTQATCERNQERVVSDRAAAGEPTSDISPCERWHP